MPCSTFVLIPLPSAFAVAALSLVKSYRVESSSFFSVNILGISWFGSGGDRALLLAVLLVYLALSLRAQCAGPSMAIWQEAFASKPLSHRLSFIVLLASWWPVSIRVGVLLISAFVGDSACAGRLWRP